MTETTRERFDRQVRELGGEPAYEEWLGTQKPHRVICKESHECSPIPRNIQQGRGLCKKCAGQCPEQAEADFKARVESLGGACDYEVWRGTHSPHKIICKYGHEGFPRPGAIQRGFGICRKCANLDPEQAEENFKLRIGTLGGVCVYTKWLGARNKHHVICKEGHDAYPYPMNIQKGIGICHKCAGRTWDAFYIVSNPLTHVVKFGVTSGDPRPRLNDHIFKGFTHQYGVWVEFPEAYELECAVKLGLKEAGFEPVQGREYFRDNALPFILSMCPG